MDRNKFRDTDPLDHERYREISPEDERASPDQITAFDIDVSRLRRENQTEKFINPEDLDFND